MLVGLMVGFLISNKLLKFLNEDENFEKISLPKVVRKKNYLIISILVIGNVWILQEINLN